MRQALSALDACEGVGSDGLLQNLRSSVYIVSEFEYDFYPEQMSKTGLLLKNLKNACTTNRLIATGFTAATPG